MSKNKGAKVLVSLGMTLNDGNYDSLNFNLAIELPCGESSKEIKKAQKKALGLIKEHAKELTGAKDILKFAKIVGKMSMKKIRESDKDN